jgi:hypothetical protein
MTIEEILSHCQVPPDKVPQILAIVRTGRELESMVRLQALTLSAHASLAEGRAQKDMNLRASELYSMAKAMRAYLVAQVETFLENRPAT